MSSSLFKLYRSIGRFWARQSGNVLGRLAKSAAFVPVMVIVFLSGAAVLLSAANSTRANTDFVSVVVFVVVFIWLAFVLLVMAASGAVSLATAQHPGEPEDPLARCKELLEQRGFKVEQSDTSTLRATRGKFGDWGPSGMVEKEGRLLPIEVMVMAETAPSSTTLRVECLGPGFFGKSSDWTGANCDAIAVLDGVALERLASAVPITQGGVLLGGLATTIFIALTVCAVVSVATVAGLSVYSQTHLTRTLMGVVASESALGRFWHVMDAHESPARAELDRYLSARKPAPNRAEQVLGDFDGASRSDLLVAIKQADGAYRLVLPREGDPTRDIAQATLVTGIGEEFVRVQKVGNSVFQRLDYRYVRDLETRFGLKTQQLLVGMLSSYQQIEARAPEGPGWGGTELTLFQRGNAIMRYRWTQQGVTVDRGTGGIPREVIKESIERTFSDFSFLDLLRPSAFARNFREETRNGQPYWVQYLGSVKDGGWNGIAFAIEHKNLDWQFANLWGAIVGIASLGLLIVLTFVLAYSAYVGNRLTRPVLEVRDALKRISEGDYSVRIDSRRTDEIGQLQKLLNHAAAELKKRESIKELMGKYLSKQVAERIMESDSEASLAGTRREVSILFADIRGFTTYSERHDPEQVTKSLNEYFEVMVDVIASHEGVLDKFIGDGLMVVFGAPVAQPDHARRAIDTALEMQAALQSLNLKRAQRGDDPISIGIGVNTGAAISGNLGSLKRMEFTVIGDTVNTAARLESNATHGQILIGRATYEKVKDLIECEPLGQIVVKGKAEPLEVWWLKGLKPRRG